MQGLTVELRQLVGVKSTAAGVFEVKQATDMVMVKTDAMPAARHYGYIAHDPRGQFLALPQFAADFPATVQSEIVAELSRMKGRDVRSVKPATVAQHTPLKSVDPVADDDE